MWGTYSFISENFIRFGTMVVTTNRLIQLNITSDPDATLFGSTLSFTGGDLVNAVDVSMDAGVVGSSGVMQSGDTVDLDGDGVFESSYSGRFNFTGTSHWTLGDGSTITTPITIIRITTGTTDSYYIIPKDNIAADLDANDLTSVTIGTSLIVTPNLGAQNFNAATDYDLVCFARGTMITTQSGAVPIEQLAVGQQIMTADSGLQDIQWIGSRKVVGEGRFAPVVFAKGAIGNTDELRVSQQHRVLIQSQAAELFFGEFEVLASAKSLVNGTDIRIIEMPEVEYFHILLRKHEIMCANGVFTESFYPGEQALSGQAEQTQAEIYALFPELKTVPDGFGSTSRMCLKRKEAMLLAA